jgi:transposase
LAWKAKVELFEKIRREYQEGVGTIQGVAKKLGVHRRMVRQAVESAVPRERKKIGREPTKLVGAALMFLRQILAEARNAPRKRRHTAQRIFERLVEERAEETVSARSVRRAVREWKEQRKLERAAAFIGREYEPGREAQVDWYEAYAELGGERRKVYVFCLRGMYSGAAFHRVYLRPTQVAFLDGHARAFEMFGGVFQALRFDNPKSAVKRILRGEKRTEAARFVAFRSHSPFEAEFCTPARGNEKGGVEREQGRFRRRWWTPVPKFANLDELNRYLLEGAIRDRERHIEERPHSVGEACQGEREKLKRRPAEAFDPSEYATCIVDSSGRARVKHTRYSTPLRPGTKAEVRIDASHVEASCEGQVAARHERRYQPRQEAPALEHYLGVLERKPGAMAHSKALAQCRQAGLWPASFDRFWEKLVERHGRGAGTRERIGVPRPTAAHGEERVHEAVEQALACGPGDLATVVRLLKPEARAERRAERLSGTGAGYERPLPSLDVYDRLPSRGVAEARQ